MRIDKYKSFWELSAVEREGIDFRIVHHSRPSDLIVIAPHGGFIERETSHIACAVAGSEHSFYGFEGLKPGASWDLHVTSVRFDEPMGVAAVAASSGVIAFHGCTGSDPAVHLGGLDEWRRERIRRSLLGAGFPIGDDGRFPATDPRNICNRCQSGGGVQLELTVGLRRLLRGSRMRELEADSLFEKFVLAIQNAL